MCRTHGVCVKVMDGANVASGAEQRVIDVVHVTCAMRPKEIF